MEETRPPRAFISYSHDSLEHQQRALGLADRLRAGGIDAEIDQYNVAPPEGWPLWCERQIEAADFVLMICTCSTRRVRMSRLYGGFVLIGLTPAGIGDCSIDVADHRKDAVVDPSQVGRYYLMPGVGDHLRYRALACTRFPCNPTQGDCTEQALGHPFWRRIEIAGSSFIIVRSVEPVGPRRAFAKFLAYAWRILTLVIMGDLN